MMRDSKKVFVFFDSLASKASEIFNGNWGIDSDKEVVTLTASPEELTLFEDGDTLSNVVYIGDDMNFQDYVVRYGGVYISSSDFISFNRAAVLTSSGNVDTVLDIPDRQSRRVAHSIKRLFKLGIHFNNVKERQDDQ